MNFPAESLSALWAPWRVEYFEHPERSENFLLDAAQATDDATHLVLDRGKYAFVIMNRYPYATGHLMVAPYREVGDLGSLGDEEMLEIWRFVARCQSALRECVKAQGFNIGINIGAAAGAGVPKHLHIHIVPRWAGDYNFMPVLGHTRIIPQGLQPLYEMLRTEFQKRA